MVHGMSIERLLLRQAGVLTMAQAVSCGLSADTVQRRVRTGAWDRLHPGVYLAGGHRLCPEARVRAAALWAGAAATAAGPAAAHLHGMMSDAPEVIDVTIPRGAHRRPQPGIRLRRRDLQLDDRVTVDGLPLTAKPLTALEAAVALPNGGVFLDRALQRHVRFPALYRAYCRNLGRRGSPAAGRLIAAAADRADSAAERLLVGLLRGAGLAGWVVGHPFGPYRVDVAFPAQRVAIEVDGWAWHVDVERFAADRRKGNALTGAGWDLLRYTWHDLDGRPEAVVAEIRAALHRAAAAP